MAQRRKHIIPSLARKMSREVHNVSMLTDALHDLRVALHRLGREILVYLAIILFTWQMLWELVTRLVHTLF